VRAVLPPTVNLKAINSEIIRSFGPRSLRPIELLGPLPGEFVVSRKSSPIAAEVNSSPLADVPLIPVPEVARREGITKGIVLKAAAALGIEPRRTASNRDHLTFNQAVRIIEHLHRAAQQPS